MSTTLVEKQQALDAARKEARDFYAANPVEKIAEDATLKDQATQHNRKMADLSDEVVTLQSIEEGQKAANEGRKSAGRAINDDDGEVTTKSTKAFDMDTAWNESPGVARLKAVGDQFKGEIEL